MKFLLVDGTNVVMRYVGAMGPDVPERVLTGTLRAFREAVAASASTHLLVALDSAVGSWRKAQYPDYKAQRPEGLTSSWSNQLAMCCAMQGYRTVRVPEFEADDVLASLAARCARAGHTAAVLSGDSDLLALASLFCDVWQFGKAGEPRYVQRSMAWIAAKYQLAHAGQLPLYKALVGEPGDNLPGVAGIGPVKARKLLAQYPTIDELRRCPALTPDEKAQLDLMLTLVTLREDAPVEPIHPHECRATGLTPADAPL